MILRRGDSGKAVRKLQRSLGFTGDDVDGDFGPATQKAVRAFQRKNGLVADGVAGPKTFEALSGVDTSKRLSQGDIERIADRLDAEVAAVMAINEVESRGSGFLDDGRAVILFERHVMRRNLEDIGRDADLLSQYLPDIINQSTGGYQGGSAEYDRLHLARQVDEACAISAASWGLFQIMGHHYATLGFESPQAMEAAANESEGAQLEMFAAFVEADKRLHQALKDRDWETFARIYNGPAYAKHDYHGRMAEAFNDHSEALKEAA
ncbi:N-acetylmuramidase family protein [Halomonas janggokensis]|uniref:N-acetylmuramidase family protein n=1 Tax=Vreelandella janggokensis TaxID=370767 RepID=A0ABT4IS66_9GAMM|nr:N-acetylmuramidase family protein [Halomonas janggokensis]MCZ0926448.1 N-acetylmuramidase family protein [Halomonas janggokensis]MCZ0928986.1 N-acetylmuramidase family protein [Halomonas janggokensis]